MQWSGPGQEAERGTDYVDLYQIHRFDPDTPVEETILKNPVVTAPIVGPTKPHHLTDASAALDITLTGEGVRALEEHYTPRLPTGM